MTRKTLLGTAGLALVVLAAAAAWTWKTRFSPEPPLSRDPLPESTALTASLSLELENFIPDGASGVIGLPHLESTIAEFKKSALYAQLTSQIAAAKEKAAQQFPLKIPQPPAADLLDWTAKTLGHGFVAAVYPRQGPTTGSVAGAQALMTKHALFIARAPEKFSWQGSPFEAAVKSGVEDVYRDVPLKKIGPLLTLAVAPSKIGPLLIASADGDLVKQCIDVLAGASGSLGAAAWAQAAAKNIPADSFFYSFSNTKALGIKNYTDWTSLGMAWDGGLRYHGHAHYAADMPAEIRSAFEIGPADYPLMSWVPSDGFFFVAFNSLALGKTLPPLKELLASPGSSNQTLQAVAASDWLKFADEIGEQAAVGVPGIHKTTTGTEVDFFAVLELRAPLRMRLSLGHSLRSMPGAAAEPRSIAGGGPCYFVKPRDSKPAGMSVYVCQKDRWLLVTHTEAGMNELLARYNAPPKPVPFAPSNPKSNLIAFIDVHALFKNIAELVQGPNRGLWASLAETMSPFGRGNLTATFEKDGSTSWFSQPFNNLGAAEWAAKLAPLQPWLDVMATAQQRGKVLGLVEKDLTELRVALYKYKAVAGRYPRTLRMLTPKYLKTIPADPLTGSRRAGPSPDGHGGWVYNPRTGSILLNTKRPDIAGAPAQMTPQERNTLMNLMSLRRGVLSMRLGVQKAFPADLGQLVTLKLLPALPQALAAEHPPTSLATNYASRDPAKLRDTGGWGYIPETGTVFIDCTHKDPAGRLWYQY